MNKRPRGFILYDEALNLLLMLSPKQAGAVIQAAGRYFLKGESPEHLDLAEQMTFSMIQNGIEASKAKYEEQCERNRRNAAHKRKSEQPTGNQSHPVAPNVMEYNITEYNQNITETERNETEHNGSSSVFPPSLDAVKVFCEEEGLKIDSTHFYKYYTDRGWRLTGGDKVTDWKATARSWAKKEREPEAAADWNRHGAYTEGLDVL